MGILALGIIEREKLHRLLHELSRKHYSEDDKAGIWGPTMSEYNRGKPPMERTANALLKECDLPANIYGWEQVLEENSLSLPALKECHNHKWSDGGYAVDEDCNLFYSPNNNLRRTLELLEARGI